MLKGDDDQDYMKGWYLTSQNQYVELQLRLQELEEAEELEEDRQNEKYAKPLYEEAKQRYADD